MEQEIKFIALPSSRDIQRELERQGYVAYDTVNNKRTMERMIERYRSAQRRVVQAQRKAACIAAEVMRPQEFRHAQMEYRDQVRKLREKFEDDCVKIFSETCTKGL